jgi:hypothetical protein
VIHRLSTSSDATAMAARAARVRWKRMTCEGRPVEVLASRQGSPRLL